MPVSSAQPISRLLKDTALFGRGACKTSKCCPVLGWREHVMLRRRKSVNSLTAAEKTALVTAIKALKANGSWDTYVNEHNTAMASATVLPGEPNDPSYRNVAHRGPSFGPWHREFLRRL